MAELQPVPNKPSPVAGREGAVALLLAIALLAVIIKPWGSTTDRAEATASPFPSHTAAPSTAVGGDSGLQVALFGPFEPTPEWSIWPAGYFVSVMYVARAPRREVPPSVAPSRRPGASPPASATPSASPEPGAEWPSTIEVGADDHLLWLGIDTPRGWTLDSAVLRRIDDDGTSSVVATRMIPSPWPSHFSVLAMAAGGDRGRLAVWPAGDYRLTLSVSPGGIRRTLEIRIGTTAAPTTDQHGGQR
jgi:hypothetical protein